MLFTCEAALQSTVGLLKRNVSLFNTAALQTLSQMALQQEQRHATSAVIIDNAGSVLAGQILHVAAGVVPLPPLLHPPAHLAMHPGCAVLMHRQPARGGQQ